MLSKATTVPRQAQPRNVYVGELGYYAGDVLMAKKIAKKNQSVYVTVDELKLLSLETSGNSLESLRQDRLKQDKETRQRLSKQRIENWDNTITGLQRKRIQIREEKAAQEERERQKIDEAYRKEEELNRAAALERARRLQYFEKDAVKNLHSKLLLCKVLEESNERDLQLEYKSKSFNADQYLDEKYEKLAIEKAREEMRNEFIRAAENKKKDIELAQDHLRQAKERREKEAFEAKINLEEGLGIRKMDQDYNSEQILIQKDKKEKSKQLQQQLLNNIYMAKEKRKADKQKELVESERAELWRSRKIKQYKMKKEMEKKWEEEASRHRDEIGERQMKIMSEDLRKREEQIARAAYKKEAQETNAAEIKAQKMRQENEKMKDYFDAMMRRKGEEARERKEADKRILAEYEAIRIDAMEQKRKKKEQVLQRDIELQQFHLDQIEHTRRRNDALKKEILNDELKIIQNADTEDTLLLEYVDTLESEGWVSHNPRFKRHVEDHIKKPFLAKHVVSAISASNPSLAADTVLNTSKDRLGFALGGYQKVDLARNSIPGGDFVTNSGSTDPHHRQPLGGVTLKNYV